MLLRSQPVERHKGVVDANEAEVAVPEPDPDGRRDEHRVQLRVRLLRRPEEQGVVDRERDATRDLVRELEVRRPESAGPTRRSRARSSRAAARAPRAGRRCTRPPRARVVERQVLLVDGCARERVVPDVLDQQRLPAPDHLTDGMRLVRSG